MLLFNFLPKSGGVVQTTTTIQRPQHLHSTVQVWSVDGDAFHIYRIHCPHRVFVPDDPKVQEGRRRDAKRFRLGYDRSRSNLPTRYVINPIHIDV